MYKCVGTIACIMSCKLCKLHHYSMLCSHTHSDTIYIIHPKKNDTITPTQYAYFVYIPCFRNKMVHQIDVLFHFETELFNFNVKQSHGL